MKTSLKILYVGALWEGGTCLQRMRALEDLGNNVVPVDTEPPMERKRIAAAGRERCLKSGYSYHDRIKEMLKIIEQFKINPS